MAGVDLALVATCLLMGMAGTPHCAAMCGPGCAALTCNRLAGPSLGAGLAFHGGRTLAYAAAGALAGTGVGSLGPAGDAAPWLKPFWVLLHCAALGLGLWMLLTARQPAWMTRMGTNRPASDASTASATSGTAAVAAGQAGWQPMSSPRSRAWAAGTAGALWVAWPCGLLQSALVVAALCQTPVAAGTAMGGFALASAPGLLATPWLLTRLRQGAGCGSAPPADAGRMVRIAIRTAGALLAAGAVFALQRDLLSRIVAYCGLG